MDPYWSISASGSYKTFGNFVMDLVEEYDIKKPELSTEELEHLEIAFSLDMCCLNGLKIGTAASAYGTSDRNDAWSVQRFNQLVSSVPGASLLEMVMVFIGSACEYDRSSSCRVEENAAKLAGFIKRNAMLASTRKPAPNLKRVIEQIKLTLASSEPKTPEDILSLDIAASESVETKACAGCLGAVESSRVMKVQTVLCALHEMEMSGAFGAGNVLSRMRSTDVGSPVCECA
jgi:hypothetical protein